jgi:predicted GIY-YIG superfamily endonuclease
MTVEHHDPAHLAAPEWAQRAAAYRDRLIGNLKPRPTTADQQAISDYLGVNDATIASLHPLSFAGWLRRQLGQGTAAASFSWRYLFICRKNPPDLLPVGAPSIRAHLVATAGEDPRLLQLLDQAVDAYNQFLDGSPRGRKFKAGANQRHTLYRFWSRDGVLLYIGITSDAFTRFKAHSRSKDWFLEVHSATLDHFESRDELAEAEIAAIKREKPLYNVAHNGNPVVDHEPDDAESDPGNDDPASREPLIIPTPSAKSHKAASPPVTRRPEPEAPPRSAPPVVDPRVQAAELRSQAGRLLAEARRIEGQELSASPPRQPDRQPPATRNHDPKDPWNGLSPAARTLAENVMTKMEAEGLVVRYEDGHWAPGPRIREVRLSTDPD